MKNYDCDFKLNGRKMKEKLTIGLFGFGCVGGGLYEVLNRSSLLRASIKTICIKDPNKKRDISDYILTTDRYSILNDEDINVVVELIDDAEAAYEIVSEAIRRGKHVVTANKKMVAYHLDELIALSKEYGVSLLYEASVCGSIPIIRNLEEYYNNDSLSSVLGICNGTTNYILTQTNQGLAFDEALTKAQELGFAESDPTMDIDGFDSKFKLLLLIKHAFGITVEPNDIVNTGIRNIQLGDLNYAAEKGYKVKLFSRAQKIGKHVISFVAPHFVPSDHFAYNVENEFNAVVVEALFSDKQLFLGKGAGSYPTASAVLSDVSALLYDYNYEYKKEKIALDVRFTNDFYISIYLGAANEESLSGISFTEDFTYYKSSNHVYKTGRILFSELSKVDFNKRNDLFYAILPEDKVELSENSSVLRSLQALSEIN
jgi:homoserine dehydrogenase